MKLLNSILFLVLSLKAIAGESFIPLKSELRVPADDLIFNGKVISSREASQLKIDLANLSPRENSIWDNNIQVIDDQNVIDVEDNQVLSFEGVIASQSGLLRFNSISEVNGQLYTVHLDKTLHTLLLRKNFLRKLGYKIPALKYIKKIKVKFEDKEQLEKFLSRAIPENTLGNAQRWVVEQAENEITLQDVVISEPSEEDFYNVAMGVPPQSINSRTTKALVAIYAILDLYESVNKFEWVAGRLDNSQLLLNHFTFNSFNSSIDDIKWILQKINKLNKSDIKELVDNAFYPRGVNELVVEKISSRINSLNKLLNLQYKIEINNKLNIDGLVLDGKLLKEDYTGFASRFAHGDVESPLDQMRYFLFSKLNSNIIDNGINFLNTKLEAYDVSEKRNEYFKKQFDDGLKHFLETGELRPIGVGTWTSPVFNVNLILSRDIVVGNYLGTNNLVQLVDTIGAGVNLGMLVGIEGIGNNLASSFRAGASIVRTFSHLKPVKSLRSSAKEPFKNIFVNLLKKSLKDDYKALYDLKDYSDAEKEKNQRIQELMTEIDKGLAVGESLILTDRLVPSASLNLNFSQNLVGAGVGIKGGLVVVKRIHLYKKAPKILQVFDDSGLSKTIDLNFHISGLIQILKINNQYDFGKYKIKSYMVNLSSDLEENKDLFINALGVYEVLKSKNFDVLDSKITPVEIKAKFTDKTFGLSFLLWKAKNVRGFTEYSVKAKDGIEGDFITYTKDYMYGANIESFSKQMANYYLKELNENISITDESDKNPADTFYGKSRTQSLRFEASLDENKSIQNPFFSISDQRQGWTQSEKSVIKYIKALNQKFQFPLFNESQIDFKGLKLYKLGFQLNLYEKGIVRLQGINDSELSSIEKMYKNEKRCMSDDPKINQIECGDLTMLKSQLRSCNKEKDKNKIYICFGNFFEDLFQNLKFNDFKKLIGERNFYLVANIDGLRKKSEVLNDTIYSNSIGEIGSKNWNGPMDVVRRMIGISEGEFTGSFLREGI